MKKVKCIYTAICPDKNCQWGKFHEETEDCKNCHPCTQGIQSRCLEEAARELGHQASSSANKTSLGPSSVLESSLNRGGESCLTKVLKYMNNLAELNCKELV